jgi:TadE-like protein
MRKLGRADGAEIAEAALVLPLVFMFLLGIVWFGRAFQIYSTITHAAQQGAITAARPTCATCGNGFPSDGQVDSAVYSVTDASNLDRGSITPNPPATMPPSCPFLPPATCSPSISPITICRSVLLNSPSTPAQCGVIVSFKYPFQFYLPFTSLNLQRITLTAQAQSRMEN